MKIYRRARSNQGSNPEQNGEISLWSFIQEKLKIEVVFDVGIERSSHIVDKRTDENISVWLFEPNPRYREVLLERYSEKKNVFIKSFGFGDIDDQKLKIYPSTGSIFFRDKTIPVSRIGTETVEIICRTIDSFVAEEAIEKIDFMKIDVEGYELKVLEGARSSLEKIRLIQFEFGGTYIDAGITLNEIFSLFPERFIYAIEKDGLNMMTLEQACEERLHQTAYTNFLVSLSEIQI